ncbi:phenolpthiocerol synthesis polyketide synthase ppsA [Sodiomyces alkalinus F11]|uniref:Phenolpthiocerol synthesis polyketide synthase ppsA n=1 Tax=Sodiomyces alkalinus (strain CBS 110278 / VKM F-3762 / F11) TaxID=1314773 RepID=A0A3N2PLF5_SODAK|nr:phenolpthiocerol synthesis polyketide synthase ppsA [Sodiomyces alkalinus F11]ROT35234.1 phenolpthiocerol synthesis polyketide synthase ppsA [Sodiomyces alkalinus F11]
MVYYHKHGGTGITVESSGVCTGVLPAILASAFSSYLSAEFIKTAVEIFRVAFWIGLRNSLWCLSALGSQWREQSSVLGVFNTSRAKVDEQLTSYKSTQELPDDKLRVSAVFDEDTLSITGLGESLVAFKSVLQASSDAPTCRWAHVHGFYHGGDAMSVLVKEVLSDVQRHDIKFPDWTSLHAPVRSVATSRHFEPTDDNSSLLELACQTIFTHSVDWKQTLNGIIESCSEKLTNDPEADMRLIGLGPSSRSLMQVSKMNAGHPGLRVFRQLADISKDADDDAIAIVGLSVNFPAGKGVDQFWETIREGRTTVTEIPDSRFNLSTYYDTGAGRSPKPRKMGSKHGNFLDDPFRFDAEYFNISPREAKSMDPQQRLLLHAAVEALDDAGYSPGATATFNRDTFGVYVGVATGDYVDNLRDEIDVYYSPGTLRAFLSGRISYALGFEGPSMMYLGLSRAHFLSPTGQCKPFDKSADGYCRAEGCGLVVLKKLSDARKEGDHIYGVIRGIGVNQCGNAKSITHPDHTTQASLFTKVLNNSGLSPHSIDVVEAHGTGTQAGDFAEVSSLSSVFKGRPESTPLHLCSVKGNIGHAEAASGVAGLSKLLLMMEHGTIPPMGSFKSLNPRLSSVMNEYNMVVSDRAQKWGGSSIRPRRALLNNFGAAGSNAALILEEPPVRRQSDAATSSHPRMDFTGTSRSKTKPSKTVMIFSGQGAAHAGMGAELLRTSPVFQAAVESCDAILARHGLPVVSTFLASTGSDAGTELDKDIDIVTQCAVFVLEYSLSRLWASLGATPDLVLGHSIGEYAALVTANALSLEDALLFVAKRAQLMRTHCEAKASGMLACRMSVTDASKILEQEKELSLACHNSPEDCVLAGPVSRLQEVAAECKAKNVKCKLLDVTYGFHSSAMDPILPGLEEVSSKMTIHPLTAQLGSSVFGKVLNKGTLLAQDYFVKQTRQPVQFVDLLAAIRSANSETTLQVLELGPSPSTAPMLKSAFKDIDYTFSASLRTTEAAWMTMTAALQNLYTGGLDLKWNELYKGEAPKFLKGFPSYPLAGNDYVVPYREPESKHQDIDNQKADQCQTAFDFLASSKMSISDDGSRSFEVEVEKFSGLIKAHAVGGVPLCPASVYIELALEGLSVQKPAAASQDNWYLMESMAFEHPLVYSEGNPGRVQVKIQHGTDSGPLSKFSVLTAENGRMNCSGSVSNPTLESVADLLTLKTAFVKRQKSTAFHPAAYGTHETFTSRTVYDVIFPRVVTYSAPFRTLKFLTVSSLGLEGHGVFQLSQAHPGRFACPPTFVDTMLHAAGFIANANADLDTACICVGLDRILLPDASAASLSGDMGIYCSLLELEDSVLADAFVLDNTNRVIAFAEGMRFKKVRLNSFKMVLSRAAGGGGQAVKANMKPVVTVETPSRRQSEFSPAPKKAVRPAVTHVSEAVHEMLQAICGISGDLAPSTTLAALGVDSLLFIELKHTITSRFPNLTVPENELDMCETVEDLVQFLARGTGQDIHNASSDSEGPGLTTRTTPAFSPESCPGTPVETEPVDGVGLDVSSKIKGVFADLCGRPITDNDRDASLASLGVDSLLTIELIHELRHHFGLDLESLSLSTSDLTISNIESLCIAKVAPSSNAKKSKQQGGVVTIVGEDDDDNLAQRDDSILQRLIPPTFPHELQKGTHGDARSPLYMFHDGSGLTTMYSRIDNLERSVNGIFSLDLDATNPKVQSLEDLASLYIDRAGLASAREVILCGWSFGGVVAFEVSRQLRRRGNSAAGIILVDSPFPLGHQALPAEVISHVVGGSYQGQGRVQSAAANHARSCIEAQFRRHARFLEKYEPRPETEDVPCVAILCKQTMDTQALCGVPYPWLADSESREQSLKDWEGLLGRNISVLRVNSNHFNLFDAANIMETSSAIKRACDMLDGQA